MRRIHLAAGICTVLIFVATGQWMRHHVPPMASLGNADRLLYRSRHIYILASGLVNLMLGLHMRQKAFGWRLAVRRAGSALVLASPVLLIAAFLTETSRGFQPEMPWSSAGLYVLFGGCVLQTLSAGDFTFRK